MTWPLAAAFLLEGLVLTWARALGEFGATILFAGSLQGKTRTVTLAIYAAMAPRSLKTCLEILSREINALRDKPLTDAQINLVKGQLKGRSSLVPD